MISSLIKVNPKKLASDPQSLHSGLVNYRPDVDGLRAIAVISVIIFHINAKYLSGGFLGVDIFFVISSYLITLLLAKSIANTGQLNLVDFYRRRIQRIFPALLFMVLSVLVVGYGLLTPKDYAALLTSAIAALFSAANIYFFSEVDTGYFASGSHELPLLHVWSLGVEEQFYILWPFVVWFLIKSVKTTLFRLSFIAAILLISLISAQLLLKNHQPFAYYLLPTRAWELMAGGFVAFLTLANIRLPKPWAEIAAVLGFSAVVLSLVWISKNNDVPGLDAVPVVAGSALLLFSAENTTIGRLLALKPMVAVGLISYSAYLWHWPILAFLRYALLRIDSLMVVGILSATFTLAGLSYWLVERPLRMFKTSCKNIFVGYFALPILIISALATGILRLIDIKSPLLYPWPQYNAITDTRAAFAYNFNCQYNEFSPKGLTSSRCIFPKNTQPSVLLVGDSNAAHYLGMLRVFASHYGFSMRNASQSSCPLLLDAGELNWIDWVNDSSVRGCTAFRDTVKTIYHKYDTVIVGGAWNVYDRKGRDTFRLKLKETLATLSHDVKHVIVLANVPIISSYNRECEVRSIKIPYLRCKERYVKHVEVLAINQYLQELSKTYPNVDFFDIRDQLCQNHTCSPYFNNKPVYFNSTHLSMLGSQDIGKAMLKAKVPALTIFEKIAVPH